MIVLVYLFVRLLELFLVQYSRLVWRIRSHQNVSQPYMFDAVISIVPVLLIINDVRNIVHKFQPFQVTQRGMEQAVPGFSNQKCRYSS